MNILIISDQITKELTLNAVPHINPPVVLSWSEGEFNRSFNEFHVVIIDLSFSSNRENLNFTKELYLDIENKLNKSFVEEQGLILLLISGYEQKIIFEYEYYEEEGETSKYPEGNGPTTKRIPKRDEKCTYSLLGKIDRDIYEKLIFIKKGLSFTKPTNPLFSDYFDNVQNFFFTLQLDTIPENIRPISKTPGIGDNVLVSFEKKLGKGFVVYLPQYDLDKRSLVYKAIVYICKAYYEKQQNAKYEEEKAKATLFIPEWVNKYKTLRHKNIPNEIAKLKKQEEHFDRVCFLLYGKQDRLEDEVKLVFEELGLKVEKAEKGESIDLICTKKDEKTSVEFFVEVTGSNQSINIENKKINQVMEFKARNPEKRVILAANTFCSLDLLDKIRKENFAEKVVNALTRIDVLMLTTIDLYFLWKSVRESGNNNVNVLKLINDAKGVFKLPEDYLPSELKMERG